MENFEIILEKLNSSGFDAYLVGGCVRDRLMGRSVHDHDMTTNALPEQIISVFSGYTVIPTGIRHGTVTLICEGEPFEITTYRIDGDYKDSRRPDSISFTDNLREDLARRDFTMNAIAMDISGNIVDPFGGEDDIKNGIIRCVGSPEKRFSEDALRIMRCIRFASQLGFEIDTETEKAVHAMKNRLELISAERIRDELDKLLCGSGCRQTLMRFSDVIACIIPEIAPCIGFEQFSKYHKYDVYEHTVRAVEAVGEQDLEIRRTMLLHDIGKPRCFTLDENGQGHFKNHAYIGAELARSIMKRLKYDSASVKVTELLIRHHSDKIYGEKQIKHALSELGDELFFKLIKVKTADNSAKKSFVLEDLKQLEEIKSKARKILESGCCLSLSQLAVNGSDIAELGFGGKEIGIVLKKLLGMVLDGELSNKRKELINEARKAASQ